MKPAEPAGRIVHVEHVMGTVVSIHVRAPLPEPGAIEAVCATLHDIDRRFSLYRSDSELGQLASGIIAESDLSPDVRWVLAACDDLARTTGGAFDARRHRADGIVDPSGFVKGWAVEAASARLDDAGARNYVIVAGGDVLARGEAGPGEAWRIGVRHPDDPASVAAVLGIRTRAVATSGLYERGDHIRDARTGDVPSELRSVTVVGPSLAWADTYATAAFVMGLDGLTWVHDQPGYGALAVTADARVVWTPVAEAFRRSEAPFSGSSQPPGIS